MTKLEEIIERELDRLSEMFVSNLDRRASRTACRVVAKAVVEEFIREIWSGQYSRAMMQDVKLGLERNLRALIAEPGEKE